MATYANKDDYWDSVSHESSDTEGEAPNDVDPQTIESDDLEDAIALFSWEESLQTRMNKDPTRLLEVVPVHREKAEFVAEETHAAGCQS